MAQFEKVLDKVQLALASASPAEIQALIDGLVREQIISEAYAKDLCLHQLTAKIASQRIHSKQASTSEPDWNYVQGYTTYGDSNQGQPTPFREYCSSRHVGSAKNDQNQKRSESSMHGPACTSSEPSHHPLYGKLHLNHKPFSAPRIQGNQCSLGDELVELLRRAQSEKELACDRDKVFEGNSDNEKEWLEQVEQAARRIAVPLWQHWDQGQEMLLPLVPHTTTNFATTENTETSNEAQHFFLSMEEETELTIACRTLDLYDDDSLSTEAEITNLADSVFTPMHESFWSTGSNMNHLEVSGVVKHASPLKATANTKNITDRPKDYHNICMVADRTMNASEDPPFSTIEEQCGVECLFSVCTSEDTHIDASESLFNPNRDLGTELGVINSAKTVSGTSYSTRMCSTDGKIACNKTKGGKDLLDSHWDAGVMMQEVDQLEQELLQCLPDLGELPEDLSEYLGDDCLKTIDTDVLFGDPWLNCGDELSNYSEAGKPTQQPSQDEPPQTQKDKVTEQTNRRKRQRAPRSQQCTDEDTPPKPKRQRAAGRSKTKEAQAEPTVTQEADAGSEPSSAETASLSTTPPRVLHLHPSIQFITIPEAPGYHVVQTLNLSPPVLGLPFSNAAAPPTYILVPATSPPCKHQLPPLSPVGGSVAPVQMSSSPPGSLSDTASKAMSPPVAYPLSPSSELSAYKEPALPHSPTVHDIPGVVRDYILEAKARISQTCQDMEAGLNLTSHYVDVKVCQREILCSGKNTNKFLDKEMLIMGSTDRQKNMLRGNQIFKGLHGDKPKCYLLLLGSAGMGKTTLIKKLCLDWSRDCIPQFDFIFLLDGKAVTSRKPDLSLQTLLLNYSSFASSCMNPEEVYAQILAAPKRVLIIFDGFDEVRDYETLLQTQEKDLVTSLQKDSKAQMYTVRQLYSAILQRVLLPGCTLLLSTRPRGTANQLLRRTDSLLEMSGFNPVDVETYLSQYFTDPTLRDSAMDILKDCSYLHLLCWNPGLCQLACLVLEQAKSLEELPRTFTALCHQVLHLILEKDRRSNHSQTEVQTHASAPPVEETQTHISPCPQQKSTRTKSGSKGYIRSRTKRASRAKRHEKRGEANDEEFISVGREADRRKEMELLTQLSSLAWEGIKASPSTTLTGRNLSAKLKEFGLRTGLLLSHHIKRKLEVPSDEIKEKEETGEGEKKGQTDSESSDNGDDLILSWTNPFLRSFLAGVHLSLSRTISDRAFLQTLLFQSSPKCRRRPQREELELAQRLAVGLLFHNRTELQSLHSYTETTFRNMVESKQALLQKHLESLFQVDPSPGQVLEACHYVYEAHNGSMDRGDTPLVAHLAVNLPEVLTFQGVPLNPSDVFTVQNVLESGHSEGRNFCLGLEDSGIQMSGLRSLVGFNNIKTYRACILDVITLWEQLAQRGEEELLQGAVSKFKIHPLKATQVCHIEHLAKLVEIHTQRRLSDSSSLSVSVLADGVPAVKELHKLEFELGPENSPLALPKLWELLPGLQNLQHLDLENRKIKDEGAERLADALVSLSYLEILNLSQNCIGDQGVKRLATTLRDMPKLHCLSLYSNVISDEGAESLASVLPHMASLTELDVKYNKLTGVGAQSLAASLRNCQKMKTLRMWNQCIPYGVFERLQQQDSRIEWH